MGEHYTTGMIEIRNRPIDTAVYTYPHRYRIEVRRTHQGWEQRHIWFWADGNCQEDKWIGSADHSKPGRLDGFVPVDPEAA